MLLQALDAVLSFSFYKPALKKPRQQSSVWCCHLKDFCVFVFQLVAVCKDL